MDRGVDLLALALFMATLRDWLVICQPNVPSVYTQPSQAWPHGECWDEAYSKTRRQHAGCDDEIGEDEA